MRPSPAAPLPRSEQGRLDGRRGRIGTAAVGTSTAARFAWQARGAHLGGVPKRGGGGHGERHRRRTEEAPLGEGPTPRGGGGRLEGRRWRPRRPRRRAPAPAQQKWAQDGPPEPAAVARIDGILIGVGRGERRAHHTPPPPRGGSDGSYHRYGRARRTNTGGVCGIQWPAERQRLQP